MGELYQIESQFLEARAHPPRVLPPTYLDTKLGVVAGRIVAALDEDAGLRPELPFHSRYHVAETVRAMNLLCSEAVRLNLITPDLGQIGVLAMIGHNLGHDGSLPDRGHLEVHAAIRVANLASDLGSISVGLLNRVILATAPSMVRGNLARARAPGATPIDILCAMANEADVLASLLPNLGWELAELLAAEWSPHDRAKAEMAKSFGGRLSFLQIYAAPTPASAELGLDRVVARQIKAFMPDGPRALDALRRTEARAKYRNRLASLPL